MKGAERATLAAATPSPAPSPVQATAAQASPSAGRTDTAAGPAVPAHRPGTRPQVADVTRETTVEDAASRLANDLRAVPGIERFGTMRLGDLETSGPRPLRTMWRVAREELGSQVGQLTIGEVIDRYGGSSKGA